MNHFKSDISVTRAENTPGVRIVRNEEGKIISVIGLGPTDFLPPPEEEALDEAVRISNDY